MKKFPLFMFLFVVPAASAIAESWSSCIVDKYNRYAEAQERWHKGLTQLIVEVAPGYAEVSRLYMDKQLRSIERSLLEVKYLAQREPEKLLTHMRLNNWLSLGESDHRRIARDSKRYAELLRLAEDEKRKAPHAQGDQLRTLMRTDIMNRPSYNQLLQTFSSSVKEIEGIQCEEKPNDPPQPTVSGSG